MASQSAFQPVPYINLYAAGKAFVRSYSRALNAELKGTGIVSTVACPGWIQTELLETERNGKQIHFPAIALPEDVAVKIMKDAKKAGICLFMEPMSNICTCYLRYFLTSLL